MSGSAVSAASTSNIFLPEAPAIFGPASPGIARLMRFLTVIRALFNDRFIKGGP
jgi:hypothetical protein